MTSSDDEQQASSGHSAPAARPEPGGDTPTHEDSVTARTEAAPATSPRQSQPSQPAASASEASSASIMEEEGVEEVDGEEGSVTGDQHQLFGSPAKPSLPPSAAQPDTPTSGLAVHR